jgi:hypothetical protein
MRAEMNDSLRPAFQELLSSGLSIGKLLAKISASNEGILSALLPQKIGSVSPTTNLRYSLSSLRPDDVALYDDFEPREALFTLFNYHSRETEGGMIMAETYLSPEQAKHGWPEEILWFCIPEQTTPGSSGYICAAVKGLPRRSNYEELMRRASPFPSVLALIAGSKETDRLTSGSTLSTEALQLLLADVRHIIVGAFDEESFLAWSKGNQMPGPAWRKVG